MSKIAYVTDLHLTQGSSRIGALTRSLSRLNDLGVRNLVMGGDLIGLPGSMSIGGQKVWDILKTRPVSSAEYSQMWDYSRQLADAVIPQIIDATPGIERYMICGNADYVGYRYISGAYATDFNFLENETRPLSASTYNIFGTIGIPFGFIGDETKIKANNPWYKGIYEAPRSLSAAIVATHMPALGIMDRFRGENNGSQEVRSLLAKNTPLLHLAGHVHDAPEEQGSIFAWGNTENHFYVSVNPGGGDLHDQGIRMALIDIAGLHQWYARRNVGELGDLIGLMPSE